MPTILDLYPDRIIVVGPAASVPRTPCWKWKGALDSYGQVRHEGRSVGAHRLSLAMKLRIHVTDLKGMACHTCDNAWCVNPKHLFLGDAAANAADRLKWQINLSLEEIAEIRRSDLPSYVLARRWHLSKSLIDRIRPGKQVAMKYLANRKLNNAPRRTHVP